MCSCGAPGRREPGLEGTVERLQKNRNFRGKLRGFSPQKAGKMYNTRRGFNHPKYISGYELVYPSTTATGTGVGWMPLLSFQCFERKLGGKSGFL